HCPDEYKVVLVVFALEERAELWWDYAIQVIFEGKEVIPWKDFLVAFREQFVLRRPLCKLEQEFWRLVQGFTSVVDYLDRFTELEDYVPFVRDCSWKRALMFVSGLRENIRCKISAQDSWNFASVVRAACLMEHEQEQLQAERFVGPSGSQRME